MMTIDLKQLAPTDAARLPQPLDPYRWMRDLLVLGAPGLTASGGTGTGYVPMVDFWEEKDRLCLKADLPGFKEADVEVLVEGDVLRLRGRRLLEKLDGDASVFLCQRSAGAFNLVFKLPFPVKPADVMADLSHGELSVVIPRTAGATATRVPLTKSAARA